MILLRAVVLSCVAAHACRLASAALACVVLAGSPTGSAAPGADAAAREKVNAIYERMKRQPMMFFVAKGGPNACGPGCSEWIAAEGMIDPDAAQRFRDFLATLPRRDLPVFLNSIGGIAGQGIVLGAMLREHRMTVGVGRTIPEGCRQAAASDDACRSVVRAKREHRARLATEGARCISACVYALVGGSVRQVARDAQIGIHSVRLPRSPSREWMPGVDDVHNLLKRYMVEMGVDPGLTDAAAKVSADGVRYLSRDEIARFGLETRGAYETPWMPYENFSNQFVVLKSVTQASEAGGRDYRTTNVRIWCTGGGVGLWFVYQREPWSDETGLPPAARLVAGDSSYTLRAGEAKGASGGEKGKTSGEIIAAFEIESGRAKAGSEQQFAAVGWEFLRNAIAAPSIVISEAPRRRGAPRHRASSRFRRADCRRRSSRCRRTAANPSLEMRPRSSSSTRPAYGAADDLKHDPEKCVAVFGKDHAQTRS
jgi:hypothetical protein